MNNILDPSFLYVPSYATDLRKTFRRLRRERGVAAPRRPEDTAVEGGDKAPTQGTRRPRAVADR